MQAVLTDVDVERYAREGYLTAPSVLSPDDLAELREESDRILALCAREPERYARRIQWETDHLASEDQRGMERVIRKLEPLSDLSPAFARYAKHPGIVDPLRQIFDDDVSLFEDKLITCFIYLDDADETMGCLQVVPGSHLGKPICPFKPGSKFEIDPSCVQTDKVLPVPLPAGGMIYFDPYLLHYSDLNRSTKPRRTIIYTYNPARLGAINDDRFPPDGTV